MSVPLKNLRIIPRDSEFLNRKTGEVGEVFYDKDANTLRLYQGQIGGTALARGDLVNVSNSDFLAKANSAGVSGGGGNTTVSVGSSVPVSPSSGNLWLNTNTGSLYVYINDGTSSQWIQPSVPFPNLIEYATQQYVTSTVVQAIAAIPPLPPFEFFTAADDSTQRLINNGNTVKFVGAGGVTTSSNADGTITITGSQPIPTPPFEFFTAADDSTQRAISNGELIKFIGAGGVTTSSDAEGNITITGGGTTGNVTFSTTTIDSTDSSAITFTPAVVMQSDLTVENDLNVSRIVGAANLDITAGGQVSITSGTTTILNGLTTFYQTTEVINTKTGATGTVVHDFSTGSLFLHTSLTANFTANFTNVPTTDNRSITVALILDQGATARIPNAVQIDGAAQTIQWSGGTPPSGTNNYTDIVNFTLLRSAGAWTVLGSLSTYN